ncbi:MAG: TadE/TadG family type IV pilus assembly protein, partial [Rhodosalinus sp.]
MVRTVVHALLRFARETRASLTVEVVIVMPMLFWGFAASFVLFDMFRENSVNEKAAYTIGDMLSRETGFITPEYMDNTLTLLSTLTGKPASDLGIRVSVIRWDEEDDIYDLRWSQARGSVAAHDAQDVEDWEDVLPVMVDEEQIILVESFIGYDQVLNIGVDIATL